MTREEKTSLIRAMREEKTFTLRRCRNCGGLLGSGWQTREQAVMETAKHMIECVRRHGRPKAMAV